MKEIDLTDPADLRAWLASLEAVARDLISAAEDATRPPGERDLGRRAARAIIEESASGVESMIATALASLPTDDEPSPKSGPRK